jgi:hypothetical protein
MVSASKTCRLCFLDLIQCFFSSTPPCSELTHCRKTLRSEPFLQGKTTCDDVARISTTKTTDDVSMISLAVVKVDVMCRLQTLALFGVQCEEWHHMFKPGEAWWVSSLGDNWRQQHPEAQHICWMIGISVSDMILAFAKWWTGNNSTRFNSF